MQKINFIRAKEYNAVKSANAIQKLLIVFIVTFFFSKKIFSQNIGIGTNAPHPSALLDIVSNNKGVSIPSMNTAQRNAISNPKTGLLVFDAERNALCMFNGGNWVYFLTSVDAAQVSPVEQVASDGNVGDELGCSVAIDSNYAIVGAHYANVGGNSNQGAAYIYFFNGTNWVEQAKLTASDGVADDNFGIGVSISGDYAVVGANLDNVGANNDQGSAYIFHRVGTVWTQQAHLFASNGAAGDNFGASVGISGDYLVVGAPGDDVSTAADRGSAYFFTRSGLAWNQQGNVIGPYGGASDHFGSSVFITGDDAIVGAPDSDYDYGGGPRTDDGTAHIFHRVGNTWSHQQLLSWGGSLNNYHFGTSVSIANGVAAVGMPGESPSTLSGAARIFEYNGSVWQVSPSGAFISADLPPINEGYGALFGYSVCTNSIFTIIGAYSSDSLVINKGNSYLYKTDGTDWFFLRQIADPIGAFNNQMGKAVAVSANYCIIGAPGANGFKGKVLFLNLN